MADELPEFDAPIFKVLARNDTGQAPGHQGGIVIPKVLDAYFPQLVRPTGQPTVDHRIRALLEIPGQPRQTVDTRYQHQTWGGTRPPERRITDNLSSLRNAAHESDILVIERGLHDRDLFKLTLVPRGTPWHNAILTAAGSKRWGILETNNPPVKDRDVSEAEREQDQHEHSPLQLFDNNAAMSESRVRRVARNRAFHKRIMEIYERKCALCSGGLIHPVKGFEVHAAHIVPRGSLGADDARNGLSLCRTHHWAFDYGLFGVDDAGVVTVPQGVRVITANRDLARFDGKRLLTPTIAHLSPAAEAFAWHLTNVVRR